MRGRDGHNHRARRLLALLGALALLAPAAASADPMHLSYHGGPVAHAMGVRLVDWGTHVRPVYTDPATGDPAFLSYLAAQSGTTTGIGGVLAEYMDSSGQNSANDYTYSGQTVITPSVGADTLPAVVTDAQIRSELASQIAAGHLPPPAGDGLGTSYSILFPPNVTVCDSPGSCSDTVFCAYHDATTLPSGVHVLYQVLPDEGDAGGGCGGSDSAIENHTSVFSHELEETINDPLVSTEAAWYDDPDNGEISDLCNAQQTANGPWTVQEAWSNRAGDCAGASTFASPLAAFTAPAGGAQAGRAAGFEAGASSTGAQNSVAASDGPASYAIPAGLASYSWSWGDGTPAGAGVAPSHAFAADGTYAVTLTVRDNLGFTSSVTHEVGVEASSPSPPSVTPPPPAPAAVLGAASGVTATSARVGGRVDAQGRSASYHFEYGLTRSNGRSTAATAVPPGGGPRSVSAPLGGLRANTIYHYRLVASGPGGTSLSRDGTFTTRRPARDRTRPRLTVALLPGQHPRAWPGTACACA